MELVSFDVILPCDYNRGPCLYMGSVKLEKFRSQNYVMMYISVDISDVTMLMEGLQHLYENVYQVIWVLNCILFSIHK
jgi:hypothetical protein